MVADIITGLMRWQMKLWRSVGMLIEARNNTSADEAILPPTSYDAELRFTEDTNFCINQVITTYSPAEYRPSGSVL